MVLAAACHTVGRAARLCSSETTAGAQRLHPCPGLRALALLTTEVTIGRRPLPLEAQDGEPFATTLAAHTQFFHGLLLVPWTPRLTVSRVLGFLLRCCGVTTA